MRAPRCTPALEYRVQKDFSTVTWIQSTCHLVWPLLDSVPRAIPLFLLNTTDGTLL